MTTFRCPSDILITSWLFTARCLQQRKERTQKAITNVWLSCHMWKDWVRHLQEFWNLTALPQLTVLTEHYGTSWFVWRTRSRMMRRANWSIVSLARTAPAHMLERQAGNLVWGSRNTRKKWTLFTRASMARESSVTHKSAITDHAVEENHVIDWDKAKVVDREAQWQTRWIKEALWIRKTPMCMNRDTGSYQLSHTWDQVFSRSRAPSSCKQSRHDQDVRWTSKRWHIFSCVK